MVCLMTWMKSGLSFKDKGRSFALNQLIHVASISSISFAMASSGFRAVCEDDPKKIQTSQEVNVNSRRRALYWQAWAFWARQSKDSEGIASSPLSALWR